LSLQRGGSLRVGIAPVFAVQWVLLRWLRARGSARRGRRGRGKEMGTVDSTRSLYDMYSTFPDSTRRHGGRGGMDGSDGWRPSPPSGPAKLVPDAGASDVGHVRVEGGGSAATSLCSASGARLTGNFPVASSSRKPTGRYPFLAAMCIAVFPWLWASVEGKGRATMSRKDIGRKRTAHIAMIYVYIDHR